MLTHAHSPMLARLARALPVGQAWRYERKLDGFRGLLGRDHETQVWLTSRNGKDLLPWFPELAQAARLPPVDTRLDGEIVIADRVDVVLKKSREINNGAGCG